MKLERLEIGYMGDYKQDEVMRDQLEEEDRESEVSVHEDDDESLADDE